MIVLGRGVYTKAVLWTVTCTISGTVIHKKSIHGITNFKFYDNSEYPKDGQAV